MDDIKNLLIEFQSKLSGLGFSNEESGTILQQVVVMASANMSKQDLTFLTEEEKKLVSDPSLFSMDASQLSDIANSSPNLIRYLDIFRDELKGAIGDFDSLVSDVQAGKPNDELTILGKYGIDPNDLPNDDEPQISE